MILSMHKTIGYTAIFPVGIADYWMRPAFQSDDFWEEQKSLQRHFSHFFNKLISNPIYELAKLCHFKYA